MASGPITPWQIDGETMETVTDFFFGGGALKSLQMVTAAMKLKDASPWKESYDQPRQHVKSRDRIQHAWGWCMGMTQRDVMGREVGGGFMFGNACKN